MAFLNSLLMLAMASIIIWILDLGLVIGVGATNMGAGGRDSVGAAMGTSAKVAVGAHAFGMKVGWVGVVEVALSSAGGSGVWGSASESALVTMSSSLWAGDGVERSRTPHFF